MSLVPTNPAGIVAPSVLRAEIEAMTDPRDIIPHVAKAEALRKLATTIESSGTTWFLANRTKHRAEVTRGSHPTRGVKIPVLRFFDWLATRERRKAA